jgi:hypothetical protein
MESQSEEERSQGHFLTVNSKQIILRWTLLCHLDEDAANIPVIVAHHATITGVVRW